jgi:hypothetical protein
MCCLGQGDSVALRQGTVVGDGQHELVLIQRRERDALIEFEHG